MKIGKLYLIAYWLILVSVSISGYGQTIYYFSSINGNDANSGTSAVSAWKSMTKLQQIFPALNAGDKVLLERGSMWFEVVLKLSNRNGSESAPIEFGAYGEGPRPILSGGKLLSNFTNSGNIYSAPVYKDFPAGNVIVPTGILINGKWQDIARSEERFTTGNNTNNSFTDPSQNWTDNALVGSYVLIQPVHWHWSPGHIISNSSTSVSFNPIKHIINSSKIFAYYIVNYDNYLQSNGDWTFKNRILKVYYETDLNAENVQFAMSDSIFTIKDCSHIQLSDLVFEMANYRHLSVEGGENLTVSNCEFRYSAGGAVKIYRTNIIVFKDNYVHDCGAMGVRLNLYGNATVKNNLFKRIATRFIGMANYDFRMGAGLTIQNPVSSMSYVINNSFDSVGLAIQSHTFEEGESIRISGNYIENYGISISDCGALYFASDMSSFTNKYVSRNIIRNAITAGDRYLPYGANATNPHPALHPHAIYLDEEAKGYVCDSNSIYNTSIPFYSNRNYKHRFNYNNIVKGDKYIADRYRTIYLKDQVIGIKDRSADRDTLRYNNIVLGNSEYARVYLRHSSREIVDMGVDKNMFYFDYNKIASPFNESPEIGKYMLEWGLSENSYSLAEMQTNGGGVSAIPTDQNSVLNPQGVMYNDVANLIDEDRFIKFFTNFSKFNKDFNLGNAVFRDIDGDLISGTLTVPPFYSEILFYVSGNINTVEEENYIDSTLIPAFIMDENGIVNHPPIVNDVIFEVNEVDPLPLLIGNVFAVDPDHAQGISFSIVSGNDKNIFRINNSGGLYFIDNSVDFTGDPIFNLIIEVRDNGSPSLVSQATIQVRLHERQENQPPIIEDQHIQFRLESNTTIYQFKVIATDPDGDELAFSITSGNNGSFNLNDQTGLLTYTALNTDITEPLDYELEIEVTDIGLPALISNATISISVIPEERIIYIDPSGSEQGDGSYNNPFLSINDVEFVSDYLYLIKRGTVSNIDKIDISDNNILVGSYGTGDLPIIQSQSYQYVIRSVDKRNIKIEDLQIISPNVVSCLYFLGPSSENISIQNCHIDGGEYGIRNINTGDVKIQYCKIFNSSTGIHVITDNIQINYNVFAHNDVAVDIVSNRFKLEVFNNVFYNNREAVRNTSSNLRLLNNIFYLTYSDDKAINSVSELTLSDHNIYHPVNDGFVSISNYTYNSLFELQEYYDIEHNSMDYDPLFVNLNQDDYSISPTSPAIDAAVYVGIWYDIFGNPIPSGRAPDIGVVEVIGGLTYSDVNSENEDNITVYPNPVSDELNISAQFTTSNSIQVKIYNLYGKLLWNELKNIDNFSKKHQFSINISDLKQGIYLLQVVDGNKISVVRFIKL
ncbi:MAG: cadherin domain-containing protein [Bacteroidales bacterium]|nr:cadherin domain-containing protein [Bacteroidales bacterium]